MRQPYLILHSSCFFCVTVYETENEILNLPFPSNSDATSAWQKKEANFST